MFWTILVKLYQDWKCHQITYWQIIGRHLPVTAADCYGLEKIAASNNWMFLHPIFMVSRHEDHHSIMNFHVPILKMVTLYTTCSGELNSYRNISRLLHLSDPYHVTTLSYNLGPEGVPKFRILILLLAIIQDEK